MRSNCEIVPCAGKLGWKLEQTLSGQHSRTVFSVDWSPGGAIASGSGDNSICVFREAPLGDEGAAAAPAAAADSDTGPAGANAVAAGGGAVAPAEAGSAAAATIGTSAVQQQEKRHYELLARCSDAHAADVNCVRWHPAEHSLLASAGDDNEVKLWQLDA